MAGLTQKVVAAAKPPAAGQSFLRDSTLPCLAVRITSGGVKSFIFEGRMGGRVRRMTLGQFPALSVVRARKVAIKVRADLIAGKNPADEKRAALRGDTFGEVARLYLEHHAKERKRSWLEDRRRLQQYLGVAIEGEGGKKYPHPFRHWDRRKVSDIKKREILELQLEVKMKRGPYASNRLMALIRGLFNRSHKKGWISVPNPVDVEFFSEKKRERFINREEMRRTLKAIQAEPDPLWRAYFLLSLLLGPRRSELLSARWEDIDFEQRTWTIPTTKAGRSHVLPLPNAAVEILAGLPSRGESGFVFPGNGATGHLIEPKKIWDKIRTSAGVPDVRVHDLRRTLGSWLAAQGYSLPLIGRALNHSNVATTAIYARLDLEPVRLALETNAERMLATRVVN
jgi:integrase